MSAAEVPVVIDSMLRISLDDIDDDLARQLIDESRVFNQEREDAKNKKIDGWRGMPEWFDLGYRDGDEIVLPRGWAMQCKLLLREQGYRVRWIDHRRWRRGKPMGKDEFSFRSHQPEAVRQISRHDQGIYKAPTGSGKTVTCVGAIWKGSPQNSLILVDRINLVSQWVDRISTHMGVKKSRIGRIGEGTWKEERVTVATVQTLTRMRDKLEADGWFEKWDFVCLDECHHVTAETFLNLMCKFPARKRFGMSATPDKTGAFELALNTLGEVFYETTQEELRELGLLVEPEIQVVPTEFEFEYHGDHKADKKGNCQIPECRLQAPFHKHRNNYHQLKQAVVKDPARNRLIVKKIVENLSEVQLVITDQTIQIHELEMALTMYADVELPTVYILTGKQNKKQRDQIIKRIENDGEPCIILSTIAGEALDIAIISRVHLVFPTANPRKTEQNVGRGTRQHASKVNTVIFDYADFLVGVLGKQFGKRVRECYGPLGFNVVVPKGATKSNKGGLTSLGKRK